ncbi:unnamed protein product [Protopolystoma xenopodis]|uniref:GIY-YIG domain-containing protein n=1 Tax=Protopolystoma xenopodis TaxID=117903 RepID=A0A3S5AMM3_9PLAT|nr:unnamed protein product [Protopolystoma xenopodis]
MLSRSGCCKIFCSCGNAYAGETCRRIHKRLSEQKTACEGMWLRKSELAENLARTGHQIDLSNVKCLAEYEDYTNQKMEYQGDDKGEENTFLALSTQHEKTDKLECSGVYRIKCGNCEQKYIGETGRKIGRRIKEHQRLCKNMDTQR